MTEAKAEGELLKNANFRIAVSNGCGMDLHRIFGVKIDRVILNGVDTTIFKPIIGDHANEPPVAGNRINVIWVGKALLSKGIDILNNIVGKAPDNFVFHIVTSDSPPQYSKEFIKRKNVNFYHNVQPSFLVHLYNKVDCCLSTSRFEGFGLSVLEAMACGTPVVVPQSVSLFREFVTDGSDGYFYDSVGDVTDLISKAAELKSVQKNNISKRASLHTWRETAVQTLNVYKQIIKNNL